MITMMMMINFSIIFIIFITNIDGSINQNLYHRSSNAQKITFGAILPKTSLITLQRQYYKRLQDSVESLMKSRNRHEKKIEHHQINEKYNFTNYYQITQAQVVPLSLDPNPTEILNSICNQLLVKNVSTILYMTNSEIWGSNAGSAQYLLQLTSYLGIPVIAWNADNIGLDQQQSVHSRILQLAPSMEHQASAMLSILRRYSWHTFSIITSKIGGYDHFIRALRDQILSINDFSFTILDIITVQKTNREEIIEELRPLSFSEARVILLYSTKREAQDIFASADHLNMTTKNYMWIVTQSVLGPRAGYAPGEFPTGILGVHFNTTHEKLLEEIESAVTIFGHGLELLVNTNNESNVLNLNSAINCNSTDNIKWKTGEHLFYSLRNVTIKSKSGKPSVEFNLDGTLKYVELDIMNLNNMAIWDKIGTWTEDGIEIKDITWPENSPVPPMGIPEKFSLKVSWLEEPPFVNFVPPDNETGECRMSRAVPCKYSIINTADMNGTSNGCCAGFCIDLLQKFANDLKFTYELVRVEDGAWGILNNGTWNGLIAELLNHKADMVVTSIKINSDRQAFVDFTVPFLETGIAIAVAKRTGIISPKAFLEPFDVISWIMILLVSIQIAAFAIFLFEWLSPSGYDMAMRPPKDHKFSLFRTYWLVWAILFGAAVPVDCPKGYTARFMANTWATFAVVFLAIYTANLAAFMITREEYHDFTGIEDKKLANPHLSEPPLKFGTIPFGNTEAVLKLNKPKMYHYMAPFNRSSSKNGVTAVKKGELDAFIYDAVVLDYLVGEDNDCGLLTVGSWYAMTGYGFAMPKNSKYLEKFNKKMIEYRENGDLERLRRYWFQGACKSQKNKRNMSKPLDINQFMSAFLLLGCGILLTVILLALEHFYFRYCRRYLAKTEKADCFALVSLSLARSLKLNQKDQDICDREWYVCDNVECEHRRRKTLKELNIARYRIRELERSFNRPFNDQKLLKTIDQHHHHDDNDDDDDDEDVDNHKQH
uniref:Glutamate receptor ionotropic, NMDA 2B-like n=1 Tax=Dermatophagoides pteronyssinus TaxID=6956 RepID=A0A6P6XS95_DERPT|nr:glutamate receptor ionotropic, NMDA 2B-like [Dermatophagoides pteronyssinus]